MAEGAGLGGVTGQGSREVGNWQQAGGAVEAAAPTQVGLGTSIYGGTGETALAEPLLEELLMQSVGEMQLPGTGIGCDLFAGESDGRLFWSEFGLFHS